MKAAVVVKKQKERTNKGGCRRQRGKCKKRKTKKAKGLIRLNRPIQGKPI